MIVTGAYTVTLTVEVTNIYPDEKITNQQTVTVPIPGDDLDQWGEDNLFPLTGTGRTEGDAGYFVKVLASTDPALVGYEQEWV